MDDRAISMRTLVSAKVMGNRAILYEKFRAREGDDEGDRAISSESAKVMGDRAYLYENFREHEGEGRPGYLYENFRAREGGARMCRKRSVV